MGFINIDTEVQLNDLEIDQEEDDNWKSTAGNTVYKILLVSA
jgi:hypothetical protein